MPQSRGVQGGVAPRQREVRDHEAHLARLGGDDGTEIYRRIFPQAEKLLDPGVRAALGPQWTGIQTGHDLAGWPRVIRARYTP